MEERILEFVVPLLREYGYVALFAVTFLETSAFLGIVAPGETVIVLAGFAAYRDVLDPWLVGGISFVGAVLGDQAGYAIGRRFGKGFLLRYGKYVFFGPDRLKATEGYYAKHGGKTVFFGRFMSILRSFGPVVAGASEMSYGSFLLWSVASCIVWATTFTVVGYLFGASWEVISGWIGWGGAAAFVGGIVLVVWFLARKRAHAHGA